MTNLREALKSGKLDEFIKEREAEQGNADALDRGLASMARKTDKEPQDKR